MNLSLLTFILLSVAVFIMATGTALNSNNSVYSIASGILFVTGVVTYGIDLYNNGKKDDV